jgi:hypothetical protein
MGAFDAVTLAWAGSEYVIPSNRVMGAIARIEDVVTLEELGRYGERGTMPIAKLAMAYGAVLRYAGARVEDEDVFTGMFSDGQKQSDIVTAMMSLLGMMLPPHALQSGDDPPAANPPSRQAGQAAAASSRKPTRRPSAPDG